MSRLLQYLLFTREINIMIATVAISCFYVIGLHVQLLAHTKYRIRVISSITGKLID